MSTMQEAPAGARAVRAYHRAWWSLAFLPIALAGAFLVGEGLIAWLGYADVSSPPVWAVAVAAGPALLLVMAPGLVSLAFARRARRLGHPNAMAPALVGLVVSGVFVLLNLVQGILTVVVD
jgi:hypothetical protein